MLRFSCFLILFSISHSNVIYIGKFVINISQEYIYSNYVVYSRVKNATLKIWNSEYNAKLLIEFCNLVQMLWIICCFMWKRTKLLLRTLPLISSFFILSNFQISNNFISLFSGTERPTKLELGPHMDSRLMYQIYLNQTAGAYLSVYFVNFLSLKFQNIKFLSHFSVRPTNWKLNTHMGNGWIYCVHQIQPARIYMFFYFFFFFSAIPISKD